MRDLKRWLILLCALLMLPLIAAAEEMQADTGEALQEILVQSRESRLTDFTVKCTTDLYEQIKTDDYEALYRMCYLAGMKEFSLRADRNGKLSFSGVAYGSPNVAESATAEEVRAAIAGFLQQGVQDVTLMFTTHELFQEMYSYGTMDQLLVELGVESFQMQTNYSRDIIFISGMKGFSVPYARVSSVSEAGEKISAWREEKVPAFNLIFGAEAFEALTRDDYRLIAFLGGAESY